MVLFSRQFIFSTLLFSAIIAPLKAGGDFPSWQDSTIFHSDLRTSALITNTPTMTDKNYYIGFSSKVAGFNSQLGDFQSIPFARISIYPNPGYNLWLQFGKWPGDQAAFSVGTGIQVEFQGESVQMRQAIGLAWNELYETGFTQRNISIHARYGRGEKTYQYGVMGILNMHHIVIEDEYGIPDYDKIYVQGIPYISWMFKETLHVSLKLPVDQKRAALEIDFEWLWGKRN